MIAAVTKLIEAFPSLIHTPAPQNTKSQAIAAVTSLSFSHQSQALHNTKSGDSGRHRARGRLSLSHLRQELHNTKLQEVLAVTRLEEGSY